MEGTSSFWNNFTIRDINYPGERKEGSRYILSKGKNFSDNNWPKRILIKGASFIITADEKGEVQVYKNQSIYIEGSKIRAIFQKDREEVDFKSLDLIYDASLRGGIVITPGFVNVHSHTPMYLLRSSMILDYSKDLEKIIEGMRLWQKHITCGGLLVSILGELTEQQKSGITTTLNHNAIYEEVDTVAEQCGHRIINCISAVSNSRPDVNLELIKKYLSSSKRELSSGGIALHYLFKIESEEFLVKIRETQREFNVPLTLHFAESADTVQRCVEKFGMRETKLLEKYDLLNPFTILSHVLHVTSEEIASLVQAKVGIVHLPTSNAIHKSGIFNYPKFSEYGGADYVALGTDSVVSKSRLDLLTEAFQTRITHLPAYTVYYEDLFKMITVNGARILHQPHLGRIVPGYKADLVFWKLKDRGFLPFNENNPKTLVGNIISHSGPSVRDLMINGRFIISNRRHNLIDESNLLSEIQKRHMEVRRLVEAEEIRN